MIALYLLIGLALMVWLWVRCEDTLSKHPAYAVLIGVAIVVLFWPIFLVLGLMGYFDE